MRPGRYPEHGDHYQEENSGRHRELEGEQRATLAEGGPGQTGTPAWRPAVVADVAGGNDQPRIIELGTEGSLEFLFNIRITLFNVGITLARVWFEQSALRKHADSAGDRNRRRGIALRGIHSRRSADSSST